MLQVILNKMFREQKEENYILKILHPINHYYIKIKEVKLDYLALEVFQIF